MARIRRIFRTRLWLYSLLCVLSVVAKSEAATRVPVKPTSETVITGARTGAVSTPAGDVAFYGAEKVYSFTAGDSVAPTVREVKSPVGSVSYPYGPGAAYPNDPAYSASAATKIKVKPVATVPKAKIITGLKNALKVNPAQLALSAATSAAVASVGWVMSDDNTKLRKKVSDGTNVPTSQYGWTAASGSWCGGQKFASPAAAHSCIAAAAQASYGAAYLVSYHHTSILDPNYYELYFSTKYVETGYTNNSGVITQIIKSGTCSPPAVVVNDACITGSPQFADVTPSDIDTSLDPYLSTQTAPWLAGLLKDVCAASTSPARCFAEMEDRSKRKLEGPSTVAGPWFTKTSLFPRPDGTTGTKTETTSTKYDMTYGPEHFDVNPERKTTTTEDGVTTSETTETDKTPAEDVADTPDEDPKKEEQAQPCSANCDGPAYVDLYDKTDKTKERELDSYKSKIQGVPIIAAVSGLFNVSVSAACPVWSYSGTLELVGASMPIDLVFDFQCQPWFTDLRPYVQAIMLIVCGLLAVRIGLL